MWLHPSETLRPKIKTPGNAIFSLSLHPEVPLATYAAAIALEIPYPQQPLPPAPTPIWFFSGIAHCSLGLAIASESQSLNFAKTFVDFCYPCKM